MAKQTKNERAREKFELASVDHAIKLVRGGSSYTPTLHGAAADKFDRAMEQLGLKTRAWRGAEAA